MKAKNGGIGMTDDEVKAFIGRRVRAAFRILVQTRGCSHANLWPT